MMRFFPPEEYQPIASQIFKKVKLQFEPLLPGTDIQHIGSSAIPGVISKGDLDICVRVPKEGVDSAIQVFESKGFTIKKDTLRTDELCMLETREYSIDVAIQIIAVGSKFEFFIEFRNALLKNSSLVDEYNSLKMQFSGSNHTDYRTTKSAFIESILRTIKT